ncbi:MAG: hypothetical protein JWO60_452 [Frankiales bacterium]|nr:hypothetical protein [Frankiales bacterium]
MTVDEDRRVVRGPAQGRGTGVRRRAATLGLVVLALAACTQAEEEPASPTSVSVQVPLRQGDVPQPAPAVRAGHLLLDVLAARCGIISATGTHAEFLPKDPLCRVRLRVVSDDAAAHAFATAPQQLVTASGRALPLSIDAMHVVRAPEEVTLGARMAVELELWWTVPPDEEPVAARLQGDLDRDVQGTAVKPAGPTTVDVPLELPAPTDEG